MNRYSRKQFAKAAISLLEKHQASDATRILAEAIVRDKKTNDIDVFIQEIGKLLFEQNGHLEGTVESAHELKPAAKEEIDEMVKKITGAKTVKLRQRINIRLLGGFRVVTPVGEIDGTLARPLHQLKAKAS